RLADGLAGGPVRGASVGADEVLRGRDETLRPWKRQREDATSIDVGSLIGEPPRLRPDDGLEDHAGRERLPRIAAAMRKEDLAYPSRGELPAPVADDANADDRDVDLVALDLGDAPDGSLGNAPLAEDALDAGDDLGAVGERHRASVELLE